MGIEPIALLQTTAAAQLGPAPVRVLPHYTIPQNSQVTKFAPLLRRRAPTPALYTSHCQHNMTSLIEHHAATPDTQHLMSGSIEASRLFVIDFQLLRIALISVQRHSTLRSSNSVQRHQRELVIFISISTPYLHIKLSSSSILCKWKTLPRHAATSPQRCISTLMLLQLFAKKKNCQRYATSEICHPPPSLT